MHYNLIVFRVIRLDMEKCIYVCNAIALKNAKTKTVNVAQVVCFGCVMKVSSRSINSSISSNLVVLISTCNIILEHFYSIAISFIGFYRIALSTNI